MARITHFPFYIDDYLSSPWVMQATLKQEGIYVRLLLLQWKYEAGIPDDIGLMRAFLKRQATEAEILSVLSLNFEKFVVSPDKSVWRNWRLYYEFQNVLQRSDKAREAVKQRKSRPVKQSNDYPEVDVHGQSSDYPPKPKPKPKEEEAERTALRTVSEKVMGIAIEKAHAAWNDFFETTKNWATGSGRLAITDPLSREIFLAEGPEEIRAAVAVPEIFRQNFIEKYIRLEIDSYKKNLK